ncbi:MAG: glycosyltransferase family 4 protein, partial [Candidatus Odinarchaeia archaeon]
LLNELDKSQIPHLEFKKINDAKTDFFAQLFELTQIISREKPDIIHAHNDYFAFISAIASKVSEVEPKPHVIWSIHTFRNNRQHYVFDKYIASYFDSIIAVSENVKKEVVEHGIDENKIVILPNAIDVEINLLNSEYKKSFLKKYGLNDGIKIIGTISRLHPIKGLGSLIKGFKKISDEFDNLRLVICGDGAQKKELEFLTHKLSLENKIIFTGYVRDRLNVLNVFDYFILPSLSEGLPIVILEAMMIGKPVIATNVGGVPEIIKDKETGLLIPPNNPDKIYEAIKTLLNDTELTKLIAINGQKYVNQRFNFEETFKKIEQLYRDLIWSAKNS